MASEADLLSVAEAARRLGRSTEQVRRYLREGRLGGRRIGGQWFIEAGTLDGFATGRRGREPRGFLDRVRPADELDPLAAVVAIGHGGGGNVAAGKDAYRRAFRWR